MAKQWSRDEKLKIINFSKTHSQSETVEYFDINKSTLQRWLREYKKDGVNSLEWGFGEGAKSKIKKYKNHDWIFKNPDDMNINELREALKLERALKKHLAKTTKERFFAIFNVKETFSISLMCKYLKVSRYGYRLWINNGMAFHKNFNQILANNIERIFKKFKGRYGYPMITIFLNKYYKYSLSKWVVYRYMRILGLKASRKISKPKYSASGPLRYPNILKRNFNASELNQKWVTDVTYIKTSSGMVYLSIIKDLFNSEIIDWTLGKSPNNELIYTNLKNAINKRQPKNLIIHSDQGSSYTSPGWKEICDINNIKISMSRRGNSPDNGACESFFSTLKLESIYNYKIKKLNYKNIYNIIHNFIEFYNYVRPIIKHKKTPYEIRMENASF